MQNENLRRLSLLAKQRYYAGLVVGLIFGAIVGAYLEAVFIAGIIK